MIVVVGGGGGGLGASCWRASMRGIARMWAGGQQQKEENEAGNMGSEQQRQEGRSNIEWKR